MSEDIEQLLASLSEPIPVPEIVLDQIVAFECSDGNDLHRIVAWTEVPTSFPAEPDEAPERVVVFRAVIPSETWRELVRQAARDLGLMG